MGSNFCNILNLSYEDANQHGSPLVNVLIGGIDSTFVVDTGCCRTAVSLDFVKSWGGEHLVSPPVDGSALGSIPLTLTLSENIRFFLTASVLNMPWNLLGCDFLLGSRSLIDLHPSSPTLTIRSKGQQ